MLRDNMRIYLAGNDAAMRWLTHLAPFGRAFFHHQAFQGARAKQEQKMQRMKERGSIAGGRPIAALLIIVGFLALGLHNFLLLAGAVLFAKLWQRREHYPGDLISFLRYKAEGFYQMAENKLFHWNAPRFGSSGNSAFDTWRTAELAKLEEERRKLAQSERDFADYMTRLRQARDREEFDAFLRDRQTSKEHTASI